MNNNAETQILGTVFFSIVANDILCGQIIDAVSMLRHSPLYVRKAKQLVNYMDAERERYERDIRQIIDNEQIMFQYADTCERVEEVSREHLIRFENAVYMQITGRKEKNAAILAKLIVCQSMAHQMYYIMGEAKKIARRYSISIEGIETRRMFLAITRVVNHLWPSVKTMRPSESSNIGLEVLFKSMTDACIEIFKENEKKQ